MYQHELTWGTIYLQACALLEEFTSQQTSGTHAVCSVISADAHLHHVWHPPEIKRHNLLARGPMLDAFGIQRQRQVHPPSDLAAAPDSLRTPTTPVLVFPHQVAQCACLAGALPWCRCWVSMHVWRSVGIRRPHPSPHVRFVSNAIRLSSRLDGEVIIG